MIYCNRQGNHSSKRVFRMQKPTFFLLRALSLFVPTSCACGIVSHGENISFFGPESFRRADVVPFPGRIEKAPTRGKNRPPDPVLIVYNLPRISDSDTRRLTMTENGSPAENPDRSAISLSGEDLLDDSIRGDWHYFGLRKTNRPGWHVKEVRRASPVPGGITDGENGRGTLPLTFIQQSGPAKEKSRPESTVT